MSRFFVDVVLVQQQLTQVVDSKISIPGLFPEVGRRLDHGDNLREVNILDAFRNNNILATDTA